MGTISVPTTQDLFDHVVAHLLRQGRKSIQNTELPSVLCAYRGERDAKCAVGCLIDSARYRPEFEGQGIDLSPASRPVLDAVDASIGRYLDINEQHLVKRLQDVHDWSEVADWPMLLAEVAAEFRLTFNSLIDAKA